MPVDPRAPCLIGVAQTTVRGGGAPEPLDLWAEVVRAAAADTGAHGGEAAVLGALDGLQVVYCQSWPYDDPVGRLAERLGVDPRHRHYSGIGGTTPQVLVDQAAEAILTGDLDVVAITGAEALETLRQLKKRDARAPWSHRDPEKKPFPYEAPFHPAEVAHQVFQAYLTFALFDVARRAHVGVRPDDHRRAIGELLAPMTVVAAANPHAWFPVERTADEIVTPAPANRMVAYPYTKYSMAIMDVDMAGALVLASHAAADRLGVPADRRVYLRGWCYATDQTYVAEHPEMWRSPAMAAASGAALGMAGVGASDVAHLDLYSCFASSIAFARDALGLAPHDPRPVTVTGGLPFNGGPASNYMTHSIATMADVLRDDPGSVGLVSGVGMHLTKHVFGVYSTEPPDGPLRPRDQSAVQARLDAQHRPVPITNVYAGAATVAAYTVLHGREGGAERAVAVVDLPDASRAYAVTTDAELLASLEAEEWVGREVRLVASPDDVNLLEAP